jgi:hypothetical protein
MEERQTHPWVVPLGTISKNQNWSNDFSSPFPLNVFITIDFFCHFNNCLKFLLELKR